MTLNLEKLLSADATVKGTINNILYAIVALGGHYTCSETS
jgi:hypothetical protein